MPADRLDRHATNRDAAGAPVLAPQPGESVDLSLVHVRRPDALDGVLSRAVRDRASARPSAASRPASLYRALTEKELVARGKAIQSPSAPTAGANLWMFTNSKTATRLYIVGTIHSKYVIRTMERGVELLEFLLTTPFHAVYAELEERFKEHTRCDVRRDVVDRLREVRATRERFKDKPKAMAIRTRQTLSEVPVIGLDDLLVAAATNWKGAEGLETQKDRDDVRHEYVAAGGANQEEHRFSPAVYDELEQEVAAGNEAALNAPHVKSLGEGKDAQDIESRNQRWVRSMPTDYHPGKTVLWVVGASHLAGLRVELTERGWTASSVGLLPVPSSSSPSTTTAVGAVPVLTGVPEVD